MSNSTASLDDIYLILGSSDNPQRPSYLAKQLLQKKGFRTLSIDKQTIPELSGDLKSAPQDAQKTVAIFLKPGQQKKYYDFLFSLKPNRIIFNPGTENKELEELALRQNIRVLSGCTIAMLVNSAL
jgi:predicted CoA-binding protein